MMVAVLVHPVISVSVGVIALVLVWWYWLVIGDERVPLSRRRLRRTTTMVILVAIPLMVAGLSFINRHTQPRSFVLAWTLVLLLMFLIILGAALDALNSLRLRSRELDREVADAAKQLKKALDNKRRDDDEERRQ